MAIGNPSLGRQIQEGNLSLDPFRAIGVFLEVSMRKTLLATALLLTCAHLNGLGRAKPFVVFYVFFVCAHER